MKKKLKIVVPACVIACMVFTAFLPSLKNNFTNFDDDAYVVGNPLIRDLSWGGIIRIFTPSSYISETPSSSQLWVPLVMVSYALEYHFFKLDPFIYHSTNLLLHVANSLFVFWFIALLSGDIAVAFIVAVLFGVHPLHVESVAWVTERKDVLYVFFLLLSLVCYGYYRNNGVRKYLIAVYWLFMLALFSKAASVVLPVLLILYDYFKDGPITLKQVQEKIPFFVIAVIFLLASQITTKYLLFDPAFNLFDYALIPFYSLTFYLVKLIAPFGLSCLYPYPLKTGGFLPGAFLLSPLLIAALALVVVFSRKYTRKVLFGVLFFLIVLLPYIRILPYVSPTLVSDRYSYFSSIGIFFVLAEGFMFLWRRKAEYADRIRRVLLVCGAAALIGLSFLTWNQCKVWYDSLTLWNDCIRKHPGQYLPLAYFNRGITYMRKQQHKKAMSDFDRALALYHKRLDVSYAHDDFALDALKSDNASQDLYVMRAVQFATLGRYEEATLILTRLISVNPACLQAYINLASVYGNWGKYKGAITVGKKALVLNPNSAATHYNLAAAYYYDGQYDLAVAHLESSLKLGFTPDQEFLKLLAKYRQRPE